MAIGDRYLATVEVEQIADTEYRWPGTGVGIFSNEIKSLEPLGVQPLKPKLVKMFDSTEITKLVREGLGLDYDLFYRLEASNDSLVHLDPPRPDPTATARVEEWANRPNKSEYVADRDEGLEVEDVLAELVNRGLLEELPADEWTMLVHVWW